MKLTITIALSLLTLSPFAQQSIDGSFAFQTDPNKKYSLYIPSGYTPGTAHQTMLGLHPFNVNSWDAQSWRDTLIKFAETNNLILVCPDGGTDGQVDDDIDTAFTSTLLDSMGFWYDIDTGRMYAMGFSWGGRTTYTYGLSHHNRFRGFIPIGAVINGTTEVTVTLQQNAAGKPVYIVHGGSDAPTTRFYPIRDSLISKGAIVEDTLMPGILHTIDFPNRNMILGMAYQWIDSVNLALQDTTMDTSDTTITYIDWNEQEDVIRLHPNTVDFGGNINVLINSSSAEKGNISIFAINGQLRYSDKFSVMAGNNKLPVTTTHLDRGIYLVRVELGKVVITRKLLIN
ncbi:MAG: T9SS type A sorting domain-containing protein [Bacteroidetes bacterium]|nr:T9SS type A sorting domain-containing protein [Bacteroidota bacterium]